MSNLNLWEDLNKLKETCKWVDLSHEVSPETPHWFGFPSVKSSVLYDFEKDGFRAHTYEIVSQYGTHVDAPYHFSNTGETIEVHEYPLLYLGDLSSGIGAAGYSAYYARRVDGGSYSVGESWLNQWETKSGKVQSVQDAKLLCNDQYGTMNIDYIQSVSGTAYIISLLPTQEDIKKIIYHEKKFQLKDEAYWTRDAGLVSGKTGERTTSRDGGYVRCVYKSKGLLK